MKLGKDHKTEPSPCPFCGSDQDGHTGIDNDEPPAPGDISICVECHCLSIYGPGLELRKPTDDETAEALKMPEVRDGLEVLRRIDKMERH